MAEFSSPGRAKDVIIRGGHNIDPVWIETAAESHTDVHLAVAVGEPDPYAGEVPALFVTAQPGATLDPEEVRDFVHQHIAEPPARPKSVFVLDELPITAVGKPFRPELRRMAAERRLRHALDEQMDGHHDALTVSLDAGGLYVRIQLPGEHGSKAGELAEILGQFAPALLDRHTVGRQRVSRAQSRHLIQPTVLQTQGRQ